MELGERYRLEGGVETVIFHSGQTGFTVLELSADGELVTVVGEFAGIAVGETLFVEGGVRHPPEIRPPAQGGQV